ncbi:hypothetical protein P3T23_001051 [Paraburkholderia sp. GAS448]|uniref:hypothetical protein n=1 Tax=Paraburkholderia sp. GAS448 TaxID=3035136 RepID=UPI003D1F6A2C
MTETTLRHKVSESWSARYSAFGIVAILSPSRASGSTQADEAWAPVQEQRLASQQFANSMDAWANNMQAVNARQPQTVHLTGPSVHWTSTSLGNTVNTNCN